MALAKFARGTVEGAKHYFRLVLDLAETPDARDGYSMFLQSVYFLE